MRHTRPPPCDGIWHNSSVKRREVNDRGFDCVRVTWGLRDHDSWLDNKDGFWVTSRWVMGTVWMVWGKERHSCPEISPCCSKWLAIYGSWIVYFWNVPFLFLDCGWLWATETIKKGKLWIKNGDWLCLRMLPEDGWNAKARVHWAGGLRKFPSLPSLVTHVSPWDLSLIFPQNEFPMSKFQGGIAWAVTRTCDIKTQETALG